MKCPRKTTTINSFFTPSVIDCYDKSKWWALTLAAFYIKTYAKTNEVKDFFTKQHNSFYQKK